MNFDIVGIIGTIFNICAIIGGATAGFSIFQRARVTGTIALLQQQVSALESRSTLQEKKLADLEADNTRLQQIIDTIRAALKTRGILVTIDGDLVTISSANNTSTHRRTKKVTTEDKKDD